jgi:hypothetical protein
MRPSIRRCITSATRDLVPFPTNRTDSDDVTESTNSDDPHVAANSRLPCRQRSGSAPRLASCLYKPRNPCRRNSSRATIRRRSLPSAPCSRYNTCRGTGRSSGIRIASVPRWPAAPPAQFNAQSTRQQRGQWLGNVGPSGTLVSRVSRCRRLDCNTFWP